MKNLFTALIFIFALSFSLGAETEVLCPEGNFYNLAAEACESCPAGTFANGTVPLTECEPCSQGRIAPNSGTSRCKACSAGTFEMNRISCELCPVGTSSKLGSSSSDSCFACPAGTVAPKAGSVCAPCLYGRYSFNTTFCADCPAGTTTDLGESVEDCVRCPEGYIAAKPGTGAGCFPCGAGNYEVNQTTCESCPQGTFSEVQNASSVDTCQACPAGSRSYRKAPKECTKCSAGTYEVNRTSCQTCPNDSISSEGSTTCSVCPTGTVAFSYKCIDNKDFYHYDKPKMGTVDYIIFGVIILAIGLCVVKCCRRGKNAEIVGESENGVNVNLIYHNGQ